VIKSLSIPLIITITERVDSMYIALRIKGFDFKNRIYSSSKESFNWFDYGLALYSVGIIVLSVLF
jgi:energy-coupling factor transporter transmembrane protein EcfT